MQQSGFAEHTPFPSGSLQTTREMSGSGITARLYTDSGGWGLPTIDADGLAALALLRFSNIPFSICSDASPSMTCANVLPVVIFENEQTSEPSVCAGLPSLIALLTANLTLPDPNKHLTPFMIAESTAFATLVTSRFGPARQYEFFIDDKNYADIYHTLLAKDSRFPLNALLPYLKRRDVRRSLKDRKPDALYFDAGIALAALSTRLGERNKFFYGEEPSVLDAIVFGYLATVLYIPLPSTELRGQIAKFSNLVAFVGRIRQLFFVSSSDGSTQHLMGELDGEGIMEAKRQEALKRSRSASSGKEAQGASNTTQNSDESKAESERKRWNKYFIWGSIAAFAAHILLGNEVEFEYE